MNNKIMVIAIIIITSNLCFAQKQIYDEILKNTENVLETYLNKSSMLLRIGSTKLKLVNFNEFIEKEFIVENQMNNISQSNNDEYLVPISESERNNYGIIIDKNGIINKIKISTHNAKISKNGQFIITYRDDIFGGRFQVFNVKSLQEYDLPKRNYSSFVADFIDSTRIFLLYRNLKPISNEFNIKAAMKELKEKTRNGEISKKELKLKLRELKKYQKKTDRTKRNYEVITKYLVYNIVSQEIDWESELTIGDNKYKYYPNNSVTVSNDGNNILLTAYYQDQNQSSRNNRILKIDLSNQSIMDVTNRLGDPNIDNISELRYLESNDIFTITRNGTDVKYHILTENKNYFSIAQSSNYKITKVKYVKKSNDTLSIIDKKNNLFEWDYKNNKLPQPYLKKTIFSSDGNILKLEEVK